MNVTSLTYKLDKWASIEIEKGVRSTKHLFGGQYPTALDNLVTGEKASVKTVYDCFKHGHDVAGPTRSFLGTMVDQKTRLEWMTFGEAEQKARHIGYFLRSKGIKRQDFVGIWAANCAEWLICQIAFASQSLIIVPLYDTFGIEMVRYAVQDVGMTTIFCDSEKSLQLILKNREDFPTLKTVILMRDIIDDQTLLGSCKAQGIELLTFSQALQIGAEDQNAKLDLPTPSDNFLILYTSGTTGISKGAMISHENMVCSVAALQGLGSIILEPGALIQRPDDRMMPFLPLAHGYTQLLTASQLYGGGEFAFSSGNPSKLKEDAQCIKPTLIPLVPRILNRLYNEIMEENKDNYGNFLECYQQKEKLLKQGYIGRDTQWDTLLFSKYQQQLGGHIRLFTTAAAPIEAEVLDFYRVVFGTLIIHIYGQTETILTSAHVSIGSSAVGHAFGCCDIKLLDLPELGYSINNNPPQGEICVKGPNIISGYWRLPEKTAESFTPDGWWLSGDIGEYGPDGSLRIIDRRKHIYKLAQGLYIAPVMVEGFYVEVPLVSHIFVDGNSTESYSVAIVVPDEQAAREWAASRGLSPDLSFEELCKNKELNLHILHTMRTHGNKRGLNSLEQVRSIHLHHEMFTVANGLATETMKYKRNILRRLFHNEIEAMYAAGPAIPFTRG